MAQKLEEQYALAADRATEYKPVENSCCGMSTRVKASSENSENEILSPQLNESKSCETEIKHAEDKNVKQAV